MTATSPTEAEQRALDAMLRAGWIDKWVAVDGNGLQITWKEKGGMAAFWLQLWGDRLDVLADPFNHMLVSCLAAEGEFTPNPGAIHANRLMAAMRDEGLLTDQATPTPRGQDFLGFYVTLIMELDLASDFDAVFGLFSVCTQWAPEPSKLLRPLPYYVEREIQQGHG